MIHRKMELPEGEISGIYLSTNDVKPEPSCAPLQCNSARRSKEIQKFLYVEVNF